MVVRNRLKEKLILSVLYGWWWCRVEFVVGGGAVIDCMVGKGVVVEFMMGGGVVVRIHELMKGK